MYRASRFALATLLIGAAALPLSSGAQEYPNKPINLIVPFSAGGTLDNLARNLGQKLSESWKQPVVIHNKPGGGTIIGTQQLARSPADGYTFGMVANSFAINPSLQANLPYDTVKDFMPVGLVAYTPHMLVANPSVPAKNLQEVLQLARSKPGKLTFASFGTGTSPHIAVELLKSQSNVDVLHVPYKGQAPALQDILGGHVDLMFANVPDVLPHVASGKLRAIGVVSAARIASAPDVPTFKEQGLDNFESNSWFGIVAPKGTPTADIDKLSAEVARIVRLPDMKERLAAQGLEPSGTKPAEFSKYLNAEMEKAGRLVKASGATVN